MREEDKNECKRRSRIGKKYKLRFVVVDFEPDPGVPLIPRAVFEENQSCLIEVYEGEITLSCLARKASHSIGTKLQNTQLITTIDGKQTSTSLAMACDEYSQEVLDFQNVIAVANPTPYFEPIVSTASPNLLLSGQKKLQILEDKTIVESSVDEPPEVELKELPPHLEYAFLEGNDKLPIIIAKDLKDEEKAALLKVLKSNKRAIAWKLSDIKAEEIERQREYERLEIEREKSMQEFTDTFKEFLERMNIQRKEEEKRIFEEAARQEEEKRIAKEKEAAELEAKRKIQECFNIEEKSIPQVSTRSRKF
ncbi:hypothetical protein Tco_1191694 [Tanacetum coccineum]